MNTIGFVGLGRMGANMARRLHEVGYPITALYDAVPDVTTQLAEELGSHATQSLAEVTRRADVIFTVVTDDAAMREIYGRAGDNLFTGAQGKLFINCATISPQVHVDLMAEAAQQGARMLEAPMASSIPQARAGTLFLMVAGERAVFDEARPLLEKLAKEITYTGGPGTAASVKALVNMVMNINTAALAEGLGLADALGLDLTMVRDIFARTGANSRVLETDGEDMQNRDHECYFSAAHAAKDSRIALTLGQSHALPMVLAEATTRQYEQMERLGLGGLDKSGISELTFNDRTLEINQTNNGEISKDTLEKYLSFIHNSLIEINSYWSEINSLLNYNNNRIKLMKETASLFFYLCIRSFEDSIIVRISRVTDRPKQGEFQNLTINTLFNLFVNPDDDIYKETKTKIKKLNQTLKSIRIKRNRQVAHTDLNSIEKEIPFSPNDVKDALILLEEIFNRIITKVPDTFIRFSPESYYITEPVKDFKIDSRAALILIEQGRRFNQLIYKLPLDVLLPLIPSEYISYGKGFFKHDVLKFIDQKD